MFLKMVTASLCLLPCILSSFSQTNLFLSQSLIYHFQSIGLTSTMSKDVLVAYLQELIVHEWLSNQATYQPFFSGTVKYLNLEAFSSDIGDAMLLGLSNVLRIPIVVFTSVESWPFFTTINTCPF